MKTIGVLGGVGPQATMDFEQRLHLVAQQLIPQRGNSGYPPLVVYYLRRPPSLVDESGRPLMPLQPEPQLLEAARQLGQLADFLVITSNGVHLFQELLAEAARCPILSMIDVTVTEVVRRGWRRVGVLGLFGPRVYIEPLEQQQIDWTTVSPDLQTPLNAAIFAVMEGRNDPEASEAAHRAVVALREQRVDGIILGCTELPLLVRAEHDAPDLVNPTALLAEAAVRHAIT